MDIDSFSAVREARWSRLKALADKRSLTGAEADEMTRLYQSTAGDLSAVRSAAPEPSLVTRLSILLATSRVWLTGAHQATGRDISRFFLWGLPAAFYRVRRWSVGVSLVVLIMSTITAWWTLNNPEALNLVGSPETRAQIAQEEFANYYVEYDSSTFAAGVWTNNAWLAFQSILFGIVAVVPLIVMYNTIIQLGVAAAIMAEADLLDLFFQLIIPHGLLELSAVFVALGAGLRLFWTMLVPGNRPRLRALAEEGRTTIAVGLGLGIALFISGLIEGYITGSSMPWAIKIVIGSIAFVAFWAYTFVVGRYAVEQGVTGDEQGDFAVDTAEIAG